MLRHYSTVIKKYATFEGRAGRAEYWYFFLANTIVYIILSILSIISAAISEIGVTIIFILYIAYTLFILPPLLAVTIRRLHDTGKSGWWILIIFAPVIGEIWHLINMILNSKPENNQYDNPNPEQQQQPQQQV